MQIETDIHAVVKRAKRGGFTASELANAAGIDPDTISRLKAGKFKGSIDTFEKIHRALVGLERKRLDYLQEQLAGERAA